ncbi:MAG: hypothetical protein IID45_03060 [Planctomycetes bacterium]|nr:hypothetical protein [Planctomycetota bacterium]
MSLLRRYQTAAMHFITCRHDVDGSTMISKTNSFHSSTECCSRNGLATRLVLEVQKGRTDYPRRPVVTKRFLIGSGVGCDLRLGGEGMPALHCQVHREKGRYRLEAIAASPALFVNGKLQTSTLLRERDSIKIGGFEFLVLFEIPEIESALSVPVQQIQEFRENESVLHNLSAEQLADVLEFEQANVLKFERRRQTGKIALLQALQQRAMSTGESDPLTADRSQKADHVPSPHGTSDTDASLVRRLETIIQQLQDCSRVLGSRAAKLLDTPSATESSPSLSAERFCMDRDLLPTGPVTPANPRSAA